MISSTVDIHNTRKEEIDKSVEDKNIKINGASEKSRLPCSTSQILLIIVPITVVVLFAVIFIPVYIVENQDDDNEKVKEEFDQYEENIVNITYATLTPKDGYDNILIFLGGISDVSHKYFKFFKSQNTFVPKGTKIYFLSGQPRTMKFMIDYYGYTEAVPGWFNIDSGANLVPEDDFTQAKESLKIVLDEIDRIQSAEKIRYGNIYLSGFSQGAMMTNYVLLNSRHELGGYLAFSGYVFDHEFPSNYLVDSLNPVQKEKLESRKNYHILATHSFNDDAVFYPLASSTYYTYYKDYTDLKLLSFGYLTHKFPEQPIHPYVKKWMKESMGK